MWRCGRPAGRPLASWPGAGCARRDQRLRRCRRARRPAAGVPSVRWLIPRVPRPIAAAGPRSPPGSCSRLAGRAPVRRARACDVTEDRYRAGPPFICGCRKHRCHAAQPQGCDEEECYPARAVTAMPPARRGFPAPGRFEVLSVSCMIESPAPVCATPGSIRRAGRSAQPIRSKRSGFGGAANSGPARILTGWRDPLNTAAGLVRGMAEASAMRFMPARPRATLRGAQWRNPADGRGRHRLPPWRSGQFLRCSRKCGGGLPGTSRWAAGQPAGRVQHSIRPKAGCGTALRDRRPTCVRSGAKGRRQRRLGALRTGSRRLRCGHGGKPAEPILIIPVTVATPPT